MKKKTYCLWGSCANFDPQNPDKCDHEDFIAVAKEVAVLSLEKAKQKYPDANFCEDWKADNQIGSFQK